MKRLLPYLIISIIITVSCKNRGSVVDKEKYKQEIIQAEHDFAKMVKEQGMQAGFAFFADSNAVMRRADESLIIGKTAIEEHFGKSRYKDAILEWEVDFVDVAESGDLGYTYGRYTFVAKDSMGNLVKSAGVFHTVWKRQGDGTWRYVWD
ncbi:MAG: nuclear transport factor 2 family protein [Bacteroidales bacterium]|nr:nuclear transport factor 2 family protein [Bacteroidales bacterium]